MAEAPFYINKWVTFATCAAVQLSAGLAYTFGMFSSDFKDIFGWSQSQLTGFATALNLGAFSAFIPGSVYNALKGYGGIGPRVCLIIAAAECFTGMGVLWAATTGRVTLSYPILLLAGFLFTNSNAFMDVTAVSCNVGNWPNDRGSVVGVMKAAVGLSASVYGVVYATMRLDTPSYFLLCLFVPTLSCLLAVPFVNQVPWIQRSELMPHGLLTTASRFFMSYQVLFLLAVFTTLASVLMHNDPRASTRALVVIGLVALVAALGLVTIYSGGLRSREAHVHVAPALQPRPRRRRPPASVLSHALRLDDLLTIFRPERAPSADLSAAVRVYEVDNFNSGDLNELAEASAAEAPASPPRAAAPVPDVQQPLLPPARVPSQALSERSAGSSAASNLYHEQPVLDMAPHQAVCSIEFHLLVFCCFVAMGAGLGLLDNLPQMLRALAPRAPGGSGGAPAVPPATGHLLLISFSVCNTLGRILAGYLSELALHKHGTARTLFCVVLAGVTLLWTSAAVAAVLAAGSAWALHALFPITMAAGVAFGGYWTLMAATTSELFGLQYFAPNYAAVQIAPMLASYVCPSLLVGALYDRAAHRQHPGAASEDVPCVGSPCFLHAFLALAGLAALQVLAAMVLWLRTRWIYDREAEHLLDVEETMIEEGSEFSDVPAA